MKFKSEFAQALIVAAAIGVASLPVAAHAQSNLFTFTKVADSNSPLPGGAGLYGGTEGPPAIGDGRVAFWAYNDIGEGVYMAMINGAFMRVADTTTPMPGPAVPFEGFDYVSFDGGRVLFTGWGSDDDNDYEGIYRFENGAINRIADLNTQVPGRTGGFLEFYGPASSDNGRAAFIGADYDEVEDGVYLGSGGPLSRVADTSTRIPSLTENFEFFYAVSAGSGKVAFIGTSPSAGGVYLHDIATGALTRVADTSTPVPGLAENFVGFGDDSTGGLDLDGGSIAFIGQFGEGRFGDGGIYVFDMATAEIVPIADTMTDIPGDVGIFRDAFTSVSIDDGHIAFGYGLEGNSRPIPPIPQTPYFGVYTDLGGSLESVLRSGDMLDGKVVRRTYVGAEGLDGNQIAMSIVFADGTEGIYVATRVPEPANVVLLLAAVGLLTFIVARSRFKSNVKAAPSCDSRLHFWPQLECLEPRTLLTGALDVTFSGDGRSTVDFGGGFDHIWSVAQQPDGKLVVAGVNLPAGASQARAALARFNPDGTLDDGGPLDSNPLDQFGVGGKVLVSIGTGSATARDLAIQADGKILVVGGAQSPTSGDFFVARLNANGSLDDGGANDSTPGDAFGSTGGVVLLDFGFGSDDATAVAIQPDGRIVVGGLATIDTQLHWAFGLARYNTDGSPDNGTLADGTLGDQFGVGGKVVHRFGLTNAVLQDLVVDTRSGISQVVAVGYAGDNSNTRFAVARYDADGALDPAFDGDGQVVTEFARGNNVFRSVAIQPDGRIVAAGQALMANGAQGLVARYDTDGKLDLSFGNVGQIAGSGLQPIPIQPTPGVFARSAPSLVLQPNGKIIVGLHGFLLPPGGDPEAGDAEADFLLTRLNVDGGPDDGGLLDTTLGNSFGTGGVINTDFGVGVRSGDQIERLIIQSDGKLVAAGSANNDFAIARYVIETGVAGSAPIAQDDPVHTPPNTPKFVDVLDNDLDLDLDVLVVNSVTQPAHGSAEIMAGGTGIAYRPATDFVGTDQFDYVVSDGRGGTDTGTVTIVVNAPPIAFGYRDERPHGATGPFSIAAPGVLERYQDDESDPVTASIVAGPRHGTVVLRPDGSFTYTPTTPDGRVLPDFFTYRLHDGHAFSNVATALFDVANQTPVAVDVSYSEVHGASAPLLGGFGASVIDGDGDPLTFMVVDEPRFGEITIDGFGFRYDPFVGRLSGPDSFTFRAHDGYAFSNVATVTIDIPNERPDARDAIYGSLVNGTGSDPVEGNVLGNDHDPDNDPLRAFRMNDPEHGLLVMSENGSFTYTPFPNSGLFGSDTFVYRITDGYEEDIAVVTIHQILPDPIVRSDSYTVARGDVLDVPGLGVLGNDSFGNLVLSPNVRHVQVSSTEFRFPGTLSSSYGVIEAPDSLSENTTLLDDNGGFLYEPPDGSTTFTTWFRYQFLYTEPHSPILKPSPSATVFILATDTPHADADGVPDDVERAVPHFAHGDINGDGVDDSLQFTGDGNGDGVFDRHQPNVASLPTTANTPGFVTLESGGRTKLFDVQAIPNPSPSNAPSNVQWPLGFFSYQVVGLAPGEGTTVTIYPHSDVVINSYYKFGMETVDDLSTPDIDERLDAHWYEFSYFEGTGAKYFDDDNDGFTDRVVLHLVDGERGDDDHHVGPNGVIVDPGGPALFQSAAGPRVESVVVNDGSAQALEGQQHHGYFRLAGDYRRRRVRVAASWHEYADRRDLDAC